MSGFRASACLRIALFRLLDYSGSAQYLRVGTFMHSARAGRLQNRCSTCLPEPQKYICKAIAFGAGFWDLGLSSHLLWGVYISAVSISFSL